MISIKAFVKPVFLIVVGFCITACVSGTTPRSKTLFVLKWIAQLLHECDAAPGNHQASVNCLEDHVQAKNWRGGDVNAILLDGFGRLIRLSPGRECAVVPNCAPYSLGENGVDECGFGDDLSITHGCGVPSEGKRARVN
jgi:hypothetical protein